MIQTVIKRDKSTQPFDMGKVKAAVGKAFDAVGATWEDDTLSCLEEKYLNSESVEVDVEDIQDDIEHCLMATHPEVAKAFIIYRAEHKHMRENDGKLMKGIIKKLLAQNVENQNANVDEASFGGRMGEGTRVATKEAALRYVISNRTRRNHERNEIYLHDLDSYFVGMHNCLTVPFDQLFKTGFRVKQTDIRPPKSINTAFQLVAVLFQIQSLQQFGGVAASHLDWTMVPYVRLSLFKHYALEYIKDNLDRFGDILSLSGEELDEKIDELKEELLSEMKLKKEDFFIGSKEIEDHNPKYYKAALLETRIELDQAVEGMYHNLNSLQSRSGCQLPFSSINYGTCTLPEGRMVIKSILEGSLKGVGIHHKTPIFPCGIFQCMKGVNRKPEEPNYDLYRLALKSTARRIYPNYVNCDWSGNAGYDINDPKTYNATMGCHEYGTPIIMADGTFKPVQDIVIGDKVMGGDGTPRTVESLVRGHGKMYKIGQSRGESYVVNEDHILALKYSSSRQHSRFKKGEVVTMSVKEYLTLPEQTRRLLKGYKGSFDLPAKEYDIPPYILGLWLGDGCSSGARFSVNKNETQIIDDLREYAESIGKKIHITDDRDENCYSVTISDQQTVNQGNKFRQALVKYDLMGNKHIPEEYLYGSREQRSDLLAGLVNTDGWGRRGRGRQTVCIGNTNLDILKAAQRIANSLGCATRIIKARGETVGVGVCEGCQLKPYYHLSIHRFDNPNLMLHKKTEINGNAVRDFSTSKLTISECGEGDYYGFNLDGDRLYMFNDCTVTHNCRTANGWDINGLGQLKDGRGNICPTTIIMPTLAMRCKLAVNEKVSKEGRKYNNQEVVDRFMKTLDKKIGEAKDSLIERFEWICSQPVSAARFMWENNVMAGYIPEEGIRSALKHGTLAIGQLGLAETLQILIQTDHTTKEGMELAKEIEGLFKKRCAEFKETYKLNFGVYYTPAENLCFTALKKFRDEFGVIPNVSDRDYFTNSMHVPVWHKITPFEKIDIESQLTGYSSAGCITYVELPSSVKHNIDALETINNYAMDHDIPYQAFNIPLDSCLCCGYQDEIGDKCPQCGGSLIERLRRVTGYLSTDYRNFNLGKQDEVEDREEHNKSVEI